MASTRKWKSGDIVYLTSPNPNLYVDAASPRMKVDWYISPTEVKCTWLGMKGQEIGFFHEDALEACPTLRAGMRSAPTPGNPVRAWVAAAIRFVAQR